MLTLEGPMMCKRISLGICHEQRAKDKLKAVSSPYTTMKYEECLCTAMPIDGSIQRKLQRHAFPEREAKKTPVNMVSSF